MLARSAYSPAPYQIKSTIAKLFVSAPGQNLGRSSRGDSMDGATVAISDDGGHVVAHHE